jgi:predicted RNase H-like HicB family nuclease
MFLNVVGGDWLEIMRYVVIVEEGENGFGARVPDLPVCIVDAETREEVLQLIQEAIGLHPKNSRESGESIPAPDSHIEYVEALAA